MHLFIKLIYLKFTLKCSYIFRSVTIIRKLVLEPS